MLTDLLMKRFLSRDIKISVNGSVFVEAPEGRAREIKQGRRCCSLDCSHIVAGELQLNH